MAEKDASKLNRKDLNAYANELGIKDADNEEKYSTKADLLAAVNVKEGEQSQAPIDSPEDTNDQSGVENAPAQGDNVDEEAAEEEKIDAPVFGNEGSPETEGEEGMGYKLVNGKTPDLFDQKTPHTHLRVVAGKMVPLTEENYNTKSDAEITEQLKKLKLV